MSEKKINVQVTMQDLQAIAAIRRRLPELAFASHETRMLRDNMVTLMDALLGPEIASVTQANSAVNGQVGGQGGAISRRLAANTTALPGSATRMPPPPPMNVGPGSAAPVVDVESFNPDIEEINGVPYRKVAGTAPGVFQYVPIVDNSGIEAVQAAMGQPQPQQTQVTIGPPQAHATAGELNEEQMAILRNTLPASELEKFGLVAATTPQQEQKEE